MLKGETNMYQHIARDKQEQIKQIQQLLLVTTSFREGWDYLDKVCNFIKVHPEPMNLVIEGETGTGKTLLVDSYEAAQKHINNFVKVAAPSHDTASSFLTEVLDALADPMPNRGSIQQKIKRAVHLMNSSNIDLLIIDEADNFWDNYGKPAFFMLEILRSLMNMTKVPVVLIGSEVLPLFIKKSPQLARRFSMSYELKPIDSKVIQFEALLKRAGEALPFKDFSGLDEAGIAECFLCATDGYLDKTMLLIRTAALIALKCDADKIEYDDLATAFSVHQLAFDDRPNPFDLDLWFSERFQA
jgi:hypothetical protein